MRRHLALATLVAAILAAGIPTSAAANGRCSIGNSGITYNQLGDGAKFKRLYAMRGMNCPSARYVLNKWLRREYGRSWDTALPTEFYDGYVTWYCFKRSRKRWQCDEYDSGTSFRFIAYLL